jgi:hypothetical protein
LKRAYFGISLFTSYRSTENALIESNVILIANKELKRKKVDVHVTGLYMELGINGDIYIITRVKGFGLVIEYIEHLYSSQPQVTEALLIIHTLCSSLEKVLSFSVF